MSAFESRLESGKTTLANYDNDTMVDKTLKFFISGNIAFNQADNPYFQDLIRHGEAKQKGIKVNRKSVHARLSEVGANTTEDLMATLMANDFKKICPLKGDSVTVFSLLGCRNIQNQAFRG